jgi:predicted RNase H-like nuclease
MPIGLPEVRRDADRLAREFVGPRRSSVFSVPPAPVLAAATYDDAKLVAAGLLGGKTITKQAWALRQSIALVGELAERDGRIAEVHPEVSFRALARKEMDYSKASWNGQNARRRALGEAGIVLPEELRGKAGEVPVADVLDAAAAAWSARRLVNREAESLPAGAAPGVHGVIWY